MIKKLKFRETKCFSQAEGAESARLKQIPGLWPTEGGMAGAE